MADVKNSSNSTNNSNNMSKKIIVPLTIDMDELSTTLIERRKRLHELANEINQWEDESTKAIALAACSLQQQQQQQTGCSLASPATPQHAVSPSPRLGGLRQTSPSPHHYHITPSNKENRTPTNTTTTTNAATNFGKPITPGSNEILSVAKRILAKKQANSEPTATATTTAPTVKSIASRFENMNGGGEKDESIVQEKLTPRSIIQKFEKLANSAGAVNPSLSGNRKPIENYHFNSNKVSTASISSNTPRQWAGRTNSSHTRNDQDGDENEHDENDTNGLKPRTIIEKFESLMMTQNNQQTTTTTTAVHIKTTSNNDRESNGGSGGGDPSPVPSNNSTSLTYVSSVTESTVGRRNNNNNNGNNGVVNEYLDYDGVEMRNARESGATSLFEDDERRSVASTYTTESVTGGGGGGGNQCDDGAYSISGSSYTADMMNQDDFNDNDDDVDDLDDLDEQDDRIDEDDYDNIDEDQTTASEMTHRTGDSEIETTITTGTNESYNYASSTQPSSSSCSSSVPGTSSSESGGGGGRHTSSEMMDSTSAQQPLMSLKDYRKQTKTFRSGCGRRRSSMMPQLGQPHKAYAPGRDRSGVFVAAPNNGSAAVATAKVKPLGLPPIGESVDETTRIAKMSDRIKELEDYIRQEDNTIRQTKDAIECCLSDPQFTGSAQHIECNRLLLISCQKKQAFMSEVTRLRAQIANPATMMRDISTSDLTGFLIFSDLKLPVKESFLNKLKSGEEKRQYFFICLLRYGTIVLQTQVISTQELIAANDTCIVFPNRMSMSNVDINFRVKIDIYEMEISPKDQQKRGKHGKELKNNSSHHHHSKFFVSPFKSTNLGQVIQNTLGGAGHHPIHHGSSTANLGTRTSNFIHIDTVEFTNKDLQNTSNILKFKLNLSSSSIPLMGTLSLSVRCMPSKSIELKGFMTLFEEDANGLGTWDRRWCFLSNQSISFWKYPEDEYRSGPLGIIYLNLCVNENVAILPRDLCARKHTIELLICEAAESAESIDMSKCKRYRLSADTREQANDWLANINYALANIRLWNPKAMKPIKM